MRSLAVVVFLATGAMAIGAAHAANVRDVISRAHFDRMLLHRNDGTCQAKGFYTYDAFLAAAAAFPGFGTTGGTNVRKREVAAFLAQTSHETTGGWATAPDGAFAWGYCFKQERGATSDYCSPSPQWPCAPGKRYYGRGPIQLSHNYNYGPAGRAIGVDLLRNPDGDVVLDDPSGAQAVEPRRDHGPMETVWGGPG